MWFSEIKKAAKFYVTYPWVVGAFKWREWRHFSKVAPTRWLTSGELIIKDLEYFDENGSEEFFSQDNLKSFEQSRNFLNEKISLVSRINFAIFVFLLAQYVSIELDISIFGVAIRNAPGVTEALLSFLLISETGNSIRARSLYFLDSTMHAIIQRITPPEVKPLILAKYFPIEQFGPYIPFNLPHINPHRIVSLANIQTGILALFLFIFPLILLYYSAHVVLIFNVWSHGNLGGLSKVISVYLFALLAFNIVYVLLFRFRMPYRDFSSNHFMELTRQFHPQLVSQRLDETWGALTKERVRLIDLGYLENDLEGGHNIDRGRVPVWKKAAFLVGLVIGVAAALGLAAVWLG